MKSSQVLAKRWRGNHKQCGQWQLGEQCAQKGAPWRRHNADSQTAAAAKWLLQGMEALPLTLPWSNRAHQAGYASEEPLLRQRQRRRLAGRIRALRQDGCSCLGQVGVGAQHAAAHEIEGRPCNKRAGSDAGVECAWFKCVS